MKTTRLIQAVGQSLNKQPLSNKCRGIFKSQNVDLKNEVIKVGLHSVHFYTCKYEETLSLLFLRKHFYTRTLEKEKAADTGQKLTFRNTGPALFQRGDRI